METQVDVLVELFVFVCQSLLEAYLERMDGYCLVPYNPSGKKSHGSGPKTDCSFPNSHGIPESPQNFLARFGTHWWW